MTKRIIGTLALFSLLGAVDTAARVPDPLYSGRLIFERNDGQFPAGIRFLGHGPDYWLIVREDGFDLQPKQGGESFGIDFAAAGGKIDAVGEKKLERYANYLTGPDASEWQTRVPFFERVRIKTPVPNTDVVVYGDRQGGFEFDYEIAPDGPSELSLRFDHGAIGADPHPHGFALNGRNSSLAFGPPIAYQRDALGNVIHVQSRYRQIDWRTMAIEFERRLPGQPIVVDPVVTPSLAQVGFISGDAPTFSSAIFDDGSGDLIAIGGTQAFQFPDQAISPGDTGAGRSQFVSFPTCPDCSDVLPGSSQVERSFIQRPTSLFVARFDPDTGVPIFVTFLGDVFLFPPSNNEAAVDSTGNIYFVLESAPPDLPLVNPFESAGSNYVAKLRSDGTGFDYAGYFSQGTLRRGVALAADGRLYVGGENSPAFFGHPELTTVDPIQGTTCPTASDFRVDAIVLRFDPSGSVDFASCLGGSSSEALRALAVDDAGNLYVTGHTRSTDFPLVNPVQQTLPASTIGPFSSPRAFYLTRVDMSASPPQITFSTYLGGNHNSDFPQALAVDSGGHIVVAGTTASTDFPLVNPVQPNLAKPAGTPLGAVSGGLFDCAEDYVLTRIDPDTPQIEFSTYLGGADCEAVFPHLAVLADDSIVLSGATRSNDFPLAAPIQGSLAGESDYILAHFTPSGQLRFSSYLGGSGTEPVSNVRVGLATTGSGTNVVLVSDSDSEDFPSALLDPRPEQRDAVYMVVDLENSPDTDGDGVPDAVDVFPNDNIEWSDNDGDGVGDNADSDDDNDGVDDTADRFPFDATETVDSDDDGWGDNIDAFPNDPLEAFDLDGDGTGDVADPDSDGDGVENAADAFPLDPTRATDTDFDGIDDADDPDDDGDGLNDDVDPFPLDATRPVQGFDRFSPFDTGRFKRPLPDPFFSTELADDIWYAASDEKLAGAQSLSAGLIGNDQTAAVRVVSREVRFLEFAVKVRTDQDGDVFRLSADGQLLAEFSGDQDWQVLQFQFDDPVSEIDFRYVKDGVESALETLKRDGVWIDNFQIDTRFRSDAVPLPTDLEAADRLGTSVAIDGSIVLVGMPGDDQMGEDSGAVLAYRRDGDKLILEQKILIPDGTTAGEFGAALSLQAGQVVIGAPGAPAAQSKGDLMRLQAALYERLQQGWDIKQTIAPTNGTSGDEFGRAVAMDGNAIVIGAPGDSDGESVGSGAAYLFEIPPSGSVAQNAKVKANLGEDGAEFGSSLAMEDGTVASGAPGGKPAEDNTGTVALYQAVTGNLSQIGGLVTGSGATALGRFGAAVALAGDTLVVGAPDESDEGETGQGRAYVFEIEPQEIVERAVFEPVDNIDGAGFGSAIDSDGDMVAIGAPGAASGGGGSGVIYLYRLAGGGVIQVGRVEALGGSAGQAFGVSVALDGGSVVAGAPRANGEAGAATLAIDSEILFHQGFERK